MKIKVRLVIGTHETKHGVDSYVRMVTKNETESDVIEALKAECDYDENERNYGEYFDCDIDEIIIDTNDFEVVAE